MGRKRRRPGDPGLGLHGPRVLLPGALRGAAPPTLTSPAVHTAEIAAQISHLTKVINHQKHPPTNLTNLNYYLIIHPHSTSLN